jgi:hypothetical protein
MSKTDYSFILKKTFLTFILALIGDLGAIISGALFLYVLIN